MHIVMLNVCTWVQTMPLPSHLSDYFAAVDEPATVAPASPLFHNNINGKKDVLSLSVETSVNGKDGSRPLSTSFREILAPY